MEFEKFQKIPRLYKPIVITEKIDGTNAQVTITEDGDLVVGSRNRFIKVGDDNFGFAQWCEENKEGLLQLGPGTHYGEWWGRGIQRGYGMEDRKFSLFNVGRWDDSNTPDCCSVVPKLYEGVFSESVIRDLLLELESEGSVAAPGYMNPEGIVIFHTVRQDLYKAFCANGECK